MTNSEIKIKALKAIGGTEWEKTGHHRIYFNRAAEKFAGIVIDRYNTNWYSAKNFEIYYDIDTDEFVFRADGVEETAKIAIEAIKTACDFDNIVEVTANTEDDDMGKFAIWHKDSSFTGTPEFRGTEKQVCAHWRDNYQYNISSLDYCISTIGDTERQEEWVVVDGWSLENVTA